MGGSAVLQRTLPQSEKLMQVVWFKRDARVADHRPLFEAAQRGPVLPLFVVEDEMLRAPDCSRLHWDFQRAALLDLDSELRRLGSPLVVRRGEAVAVLEELRRAHGIAQLWAHEETGNGISYARDRRVRRWARDCGVPFTEFPQNGVVRRLADRNGWSRRWEQRMAEAVTPAPGRLLPCGVESEPLPASPVRDATRKAALGALDSFLAGRGMRYTREMSSPVTAELACSRLSEYLAWGQISLREVLRATRAQAARFAGAQDAESKLWRQALRSFDARLHWHCHFMQKLEDEPRIEYENFVRAFDGLRENEFSKERFEAWKAGRTGYPFIDACMRYLSANGWINFRMRAMLVSFASYHLWLHWREPALYLGRLFRDYEPGIHYSQFQMQSGTTGINTLRIYNPLKQGLDQDPSGEFIRRWAPEYENPHAPLRPIVDHMEAARYARERLAAVRKLSGTRSESRAVAVRHGSRKGARRKAAARPAKPRQASLFAASEQ